MSESGFTVAPIKPEIALGDLEKIDVRVGTIIAVEEVAGSDKLLKLVVDFGDRQKTILSGMRQERDNPAEIVGKQALFVVNLPPRKMMGQMSEGMLFDLGFADGIKPCLAVPEHSMPDGARAG
jgi:tRNA-binding protein